MACAEGQAALRLLTMNVNMITRGGCVRRAVQMGVAGLITTFTMISVPSVRNAIFGIGAASYFFIAFFVAGMSICFGSQVGVAISVVSMLDLHFGTTGIHRLLSLIGYGYLTLAPPATVWTYFLGWLLPEWMEDAHEERLQHFYTYLKDYDVVVLQEVVSFYGLNKMHQEICETAARFGLKYHADTGRWPTLPATYCNKGLLVLSRYPITRTKVINFTHQCWFEWHILRRGALLLEFCGPDGKTALVNVHTTSGNQILQAELEASVYPGKAPANEESARNFGGFDQLMEVATEFENFAQGADHKIFCGDFNLEKICPSFKALEQRLSGMNLFDCFPDCPATYACTDEPVETLLTKPCDQGLALVIDHVFSTKKPSFSRVENMEAPDKYKHKFQQVSDHRGVAVKWV